MQLSLLLSHKFIAPLLHISTNFKPLLFLEKNYASEFLKNQNKSYYIFVGHATSFDLVDAQFDFLSIKLHRSVQFELNCVLLG